MKMNIRDALLEVHSKAQAAKIADYVGDNSERFAELMKHLLGPVYRLSQRAAWPVSYCIERHPEPCKALLQRAHKTARTRRRACRC